jgi:hypothetical protein
MFMKSETCSGIRVKYCGSYLVNAHIIQKFGTSIPLDVMSIKTTPPQPDINPVLVACCAVENVFALHNCQYEREEVSAESKTYVDDK